jgi:DNA-binding NtrC family response regulator
MMGMTKRSNQPLRLLIVEDSKADANLLLQTVRSGGYEPMYELVDTEPAMRAALEREDWDLITSDHRMPQFSAPEALELGKKLRSNVPIIIVSGETNPDLVVSLRKAGARDYVSKAELDKLVPAIDLALRSIACRHEQ